MTQDRVMLLIDADNLSVDVMEQTVRLLLNQHGGLHVRRAYCTAESAVANQATFKRLGIKPMVNLAAGKNSTDIAMAVDAIDLVLAERPDVVVIASSDSDFAPLVHRLREKGCVVRGVGQKGKVGDETQDVYDDYTVIEHRGGAAAKTPSRSVGRATSTTRTSRARAPRSVQAEIEPPSQATPPRRASSRRAAAPVAAQDQVLAPQIAVDTSAIFGAIVGGALDDEAVEAVETAGAAKAADETAGPAVKPRSRTRKPAAAKRAPAQVAIERQAADAAPSVDSVLQPTPVLEPAAAPTRARGRKPKAAVAASEDATAVPATSAAVLAVPASATARVLRDVPASDESGALAAGAASTRATLAAVKACLPELERGQALALNVAVQRLREARLLGKNSSSLKLFSQLSDNFELLPARNPSQVRLKR